MLDYGAEHVGNSNYVTTITSVPPTHLHFGKDVPFNHGWGAVRSFGGENVAHGIGGKSGSKLTKAGQSIWLTLPPKGMVLHLK